MGSVVLDIGDGVGALIVHAQEALVGREIEVSPRSNSARRIHTEVLRRRIGNQEVFAGVFAELPEGPYSLWRDVLTDEEVTITSGTVTERDWRHLNEPADFRLARPEGQAGRDTLPPAAARMVLPPRYRNGQPVATTGMAAAAMRYTEDGQVAWDQMWTTFCDLALAGGPRHRPALLEPASEAEIAGRPEAYRQVVGQIERGLRLVTGLPAVPSDLPGWVGLDCHDAAMARWLLQAVAAENVSVRRREAVLYLPAGPGYRLESEIKSVVTVVAKSTHYWQEHLDDAAEVPATG